MSEEYYFDHAASAPRREDVFEAMAPWMHGVIGNPSGSHAAARRSQRALEEARDLVAECVGAKPGGVIFTGGGTESCHLALHGLTAAHRCHHDKTVVVVSSIEHHAVLDAAQTLSRDDSRVEVRLIPVTAEGIIDADGLDPLLDDDVALVSVMSVNNETGVRQPLDEVSAMSKSLVSGGAIVHTDAVAAAPWLQLPVVTAACDAVSICAHKLGGPVNSGALILRGDVELEPVVAGGGQERGRRGGTVDVAAAVGLAAALALTQRDLLQHVERVSDLQLRLCAALSLLPGCRVTAPTAVKVPGTVHVTFEGISADELLFLLDREGLRASAAASCSSGALQSSHVLEAMGVDLSRRRGALRLSMGPETTSRDVDAAIGIVTGAVHHLAS